MTTETNTPFLSKAEFEAAVSGYSLIDKKVNELVEEYISKFCDYKEHLENLEFDPYDYDNKADNDGDPWLDNNTISFTTYAYYCGCCGPDYEYYAIPLSYLWDDDWQEQERATREAKKLAEEERKAKEKAEAEKERERKRYEQFLKMKEEFEGGDENG